MPRTILTAILIVSRIRYFVTNSKRSIGYEKTAGDQVMELERVLLLLIKNHDDNGVEKYDDSKLELQDVICDRTKVIHDKIGHGTESFSLACGHTVVCA